MKLRSSLVQAIKHSINSKLRDWKVLRWMFYANFSCERVGRKETIELWELVLFKANNKGAYIRPFPHSYAVFCKGMFFVRFDLPSTCIQWKRRSPLQTHPSPQKRLSLPVFFRGGGICKRIFSKTLFTVSGHFCKRSAIVFAFLWADENERFWIGWS